MWLSSQGSTQLYHLSTVPVQAKYMLQWCTQLNQTKYVGCILYNNKQDFPFSLNISLVTSCGKLTANSFCSCLLQSIKFSASILLIVNAISCSSCATATTASHFFQICLHFSSISAGNIDCAIHLQPDLATPCSSSLAFLCIVKLIACSIF